MKKSIFITTIALLLFFGTISYAETCSQDEVWCSDWNECLPAFQNCAKIA